jgi:hypothetical protein
LNCMPEGILFVIGSDDGLKAFLAGSIPDHGLDHCRANCEYLRSELHPQSGFIILGEFVIDEPQEKRALADV